MCDALTVPAFDPTGSRRLDVPPLWLVPFLLVGAMGVVVCASLAAGALGLVVGFVFLVWLERKAEVYVRVRERLRDPD
jgi:hypothetical protein